MIVYHLIVLHPDNCTEETSQTFTHIFALAEVQLMNTLVRGSWQPEHHTS